MAVALVNRVVNARPYAVVVSSRRQREDAERLCEEGGRAASLCAGLFASSSPSSVSSEDVSPVSAGSDAPTEPMSASPVSCVSFVPETVMTESVEAASCVVGTPGMDEASPDVLGVSEGGKMLELARHSCISHASVCVSVDGMEDVPSASAAVPAAAGA